MASVIFSDPIATNAGVAFRLKTRLLDGTISKPFIWSQLDATLMEREDQDLRTRPDVAYYRAGLRLTGNFVLILLRRRLYTTLTEPTKR